GGFDHFPRAFAYFPTTFAPLLLAFALLLTTYDHFLEYLTISRYFLHLSPSSVGISGRDS
ncbi:hypothetical protein, partial [Oikeobacillus pervagus]|uniref:hypothetical protein n=1 Tax=Oikeobacillus pervagus TaxID=1325931 RepID=UPI0027D7EDDC